MNGFPPGGKTVQLFSFGSVILPFEFAPAACRNERYDFVISAVQHMDEQPPQCNSLSRGGGGHNCSLHTDPERTEAEACSLFQVHQMTCY